MSTIAVTMTDAELMAELGERLRGFRLLRNESVGRIAERTGLNPNTILNAEAGRNPRLETVVRMLRALERIEALDSFLPPPPISPLALADSRGRPRRRAGRSRG